MSSSLKPSIISALVLALASFGDAFLYVILPTNAEELHVPIVWIGVLLSINRFVRFFANSWFAYLFNRFGFKQITILAAFFAALSTFFYGWAGHILVWLLARMVWGMSYSALRISSLNYSLGSKKQGFSLGLNKGLQELGAIIALLFGSTLSELTNPATTFYIFALASVSAVGLAFYLPKLKLPPIKTDFYFNPIPSSFDFLTFLAAFFVHGVLGVSISRLFLNQNLSLTELMTLTGIFLAYRRICSVLVSPVGGFLADKWGLNKVYFTSILLTALGLLLISLDFSKIGILLTFMFYSVSSALAPANALDKSQNQLKTLANNATWNDIGLATGSLLAGSFLNPEYLDSVFFIAAFILLFTCIYHFRKQFVWK